MRTVSGGSAKEAATAAPIDDPGSECIELPSKSRRSNDPCYNNKNFEESRHVGMITECASMENEQVYIEFHIHRSGTKIKIP